MLGIYQRIGRAIVISYSDEQRLLTWNAKLLR